MKKIVIVVFILLLAGLPSVFGQSNELMDNFLSEGEADSLISAYLVLLSAELINEDEGVAGAEKFLEGKSWGKYILESDSISYGWFSMLTMEILEIGGGIFYAFFPSPRYAAREFSYHGFIPGNSVSSKILSPLEVITGLNAAIKWKEAEL